MARHIVAGRLRAFLAGQRETREPAPLVLPPPPIFSDADWRLARFVREAADAVTHTHRWHVTLIPSADPRSPRRFHMRGTLESVTARANAIFPAESYLLLVEPAPVQVGGETFDKRLNTHL